MNRFFQVSSGRVTILQFHKDIYQLLFHYGPAQIVDIICRLIGKRPFLVKVSTLMQKSTKALEPFTTNSWEWSHQNMDKLWSEISEEDREVFAFDIRKLDWIQYLETYVQVNDKTHQFEPHSVVCRALESSCSKKIPKPFRPQKEI